MEAIATIISLITLIVFFVMSSNIGSLKKLAEKQVKQNDHIIELLKIQTNIRDPLDSPEEIARKAKLFEDGEKQRKSKMGDGKDI